MSVNTVFCLYTLRHVAGLPISSSARTPEGILDSNVHEP